MNKKLLPKKRKTDMSLKCDGTPLKNPHNHYKGANRAEYDPLYCSELILIMSEGRGKEAFTAKHGIGRKTFYDWVNRHPEFKEAYASGKEKARKHMSELLHANILEFPDSPKLNMRAYAALMKHSLCIGEEREMESLSVNGDASAMITQVMMHVLNGDMGIDEGRKMVDMIRAGVEVGEMQEVKDRIEELEKVLNEK